MPVVSIRDNLHDMSDPVSREKEENYFSMSSAEYFTRHAKH